MNILQNMQICLAKYILHTIVMLPPPHHLPEEFSLYVFVRHGKSSMRGDGQGLVTGF